MKVLHLFSSRVFAGLERHVEELSFAQSLHYESTVIGPKKFKKQFRAPYIEVNTNQWRYSPFLKSHVKKVINNLAPDIVHTHGSKMTDLISKDLKKEYIHCSTIHGTKKDISPFQKTDFIFGASKQSLRTGMKNSMVLENWVDEKRFIDFKKKKPSNYIFIGRLEEVKNPMRLLKSWINCDATLCIYGEGPLKKKMLKYIEDHDLDHRVFLMGQVKNISKAFESAIALLISSDREGSPKVLYESLYSEVPVISTNVGVMNDVLPKSCISKVNDSQFSELLEKWIGKNDELKNAQKHLFRKVQKENVLNVQEQVVRKTYQALLSKASK